MWCAWRMWEREVSLFWRRRHMGSCLRRGENLKSVSVRGNMCLAGWQLHHRQSLLYVWCCCAAPSNLWCVQARWDSINAAEKFSLMTQMIYRCNKGFNNSRIISCYGYISWCYSRNSMSTCVHTHNPPTATRKTHNTPITLVWERLTAVVLLQP